MPTNGKNNSRNLVFPRVSAIRYLSIDDLYCRFANDVLHIGKRKKNMLGRLPVEWSHWKVVILTLSKGQLFFKITKTIKLMTSIEFLIVFSVATFYFAVMFGRVRSDQLVADAELG